MILGACSSPVPHLELLYQRDSRAWCPLSDMAHALNGNSPASDLIVVHSIPSGLIGIARYYDGEAELAAWVEQLGERTVPDSFHDFARGKSGVLLVRIHEVSWPCPLDDWLRANTVLEWEKTIESAKVASFRPKDATF